MITDELRVRLEAAIAKRKQCYVRYQRAHPVYDLKAYTMFRKDWESACATVTTLLDETQGKKTKP